MSWIPFAMAPQDPAWPQVHVGSDVSNRVSGDRRRSTVAAGLPEVGSQDFHGVPEQDGFV